jgi:hypothetical protein
MANNWTDKEFMSAYMKNYNTTYYANRKDMLAKKVVCDSCNKSVNLSSLKKHLQSSYHLKHSLSQEEQMKMYREKIITKTLVSPSK